MSPEQSYFKYEPIVNRLVYSKIKTLPLSVPRDDLLQAGRMMLWNICNQNRKEINTSYLYIRIKGAILDELRRQDWLPRRTRKKEDCPTIVMVENYSEIGEDSNIVDELINKEELLYLNNMISSLNPRERDIVLSDLKQKDLAKRYNISEARLSQILTNARNKLKEIMV